MSDSFTPKLGRIGWKSGARLDRYINRVMRAAHVAGHVTKGRRNGFNGSHIGRGGAFGTLAGAGLYPGGQRRAIVKARITKLKRGNLAAARAHLRYIQRNGVTLEGETGQLYGRDIDEANGTEFLDACEDDRHQFRFIVSAEDASELSDLKPFIRDLMAKAEADLGTRLDWVAVDHFNTGHPHTHIVIRGKDDRGQDLVIARDYMAHGLRMRARELLTLELGPEIESDMTIKLARDVDAERFTRLDRALLRNTDRGFLVVSTMPPVDHQTHTTHMGRLRKLEGLGLAQERQTGVWEIAGDTEVKLKSLGMRGDIIKTMHRSLREAGIERPAGSFAVFDASKGNSRIVGRVAGIGLTDEINDRHYVVIDGADGKVHYADIGHLAPEFAPEKGMIVSLEGRKPENGEQARPRPRILSYLRLENLVEAQGATWLDKELLSRRPEQLAGQPASDMLNQLRQRDMRRAGLALSKEIGLSFSEPVEGERISGTYNRAINLVSGRYAIIEKSKEFVLVPWQAQFEKLKGKSVSGVAEVRRFNWDWSANKRLGQGL